jgi:SNF2 family DNA or RNA helicase
METKIFLKPLDDSHVNVIFDFDWDIINVLRTLKSRRYIADTNENIISLTDVDKLKEKLANFVFIDLERDQKEHVVKIKNGTFSVNPDPGVFNAEMSRLMYLKRPRDGYEIYRILKDSGYNVKVEDEREESRIVLPTSPNLYNFQADGMEFLRNNDYTGLVSLDMGLGKTIIALRSIYELQKGPVLIVAPSSLLYQWRGELKNHFGYDKAKVITSKIPPKQREQEFNEGDIIITNYELLRTVDVNRHFELLVLDECQRVKNWKTQTAKAITQIVAKRVMGLSGTPVENHLMELYNITDQIKPAFFGTQRTFYKKYVKSKFGTRFSYRNLDEVYLKLQSLMFRKRKDEVELQLPSLIQKTYEVDLSKKELSFFWEYMRDQPNELAATTNAKVFASSSALRMPDIKISSKEKELINVLDDIVEQAVVFTQYKQELKRLEDLITNKNLYSMSGDTSKQKREEIIDGFLKDDEGILLMTEIGTHGLNLQEAGILVNMDLPWTYARKEQRIGRIQRIGSEHESNLAIDLVSCGIKIDDRVMEIIDEKKALHDMSIDGARAHVTKAFAKDLAKEGIYFTGGEHGVH